ncbi:MAG: helix-turn-helix domain-containing protein [Alphaproteobacteria bacterium]|nr:helix-turn-helix domain-containing protein [Alphaproteobacteria bacterium]
MNSTAPPIPVSGTPTLEASIGVQVKKLRNGLDMTIGDLAKVSGLSPGMVSKIENGQTSASLSTLQALANALNTPIATFFRTFDEKRDATYVNSGEGLTIERRGSRAGHVYQLLGHSVRSKVRIEPYLITLEKGADSYPVFQHPGHEFIYMLKGDVTYRHADQTYRLKPGDSLFFDAEAVHGPEELNKLPAVYLSIIVSPPEGD